jgi:hypothetical protein
MTTKRKTKGTSKTAGTSTGSARKRTSSKKATGSKARHSSKRAETRKAAATISLEDLFPPTLKQEWQAEARLFQAKNIDGARFAYRNRGLVLYIGAGVSCSVGLPTWWEMIRALTVTMMSRRVDEKLLALPKLSEQQKALAKVQVQEEVSKGAGADKSLLIMARSIKNAFEGRLPYEVAQTLYGALLKSTPNLSFWWASVFGDRKRESSKSLERYPIIKESKLFSAIVQLARAQRDVKGVQAIVNFNYDDLIEEWMREKGIRCDTLLSGQEKTRDSTLPCYHVHGVLPFRRVQELKQPDPNELHKIIGNFVFSEDEYHTEYSDPYRWSNMTMINQLGRYSGLFVGLSLQDPNLRRMIDVTHRQYPDIANYAIIPRKITKEQSADAKQSILGELFEKVETESFEDIGVRVIWTEGIKEIPDRILDICNIDSRER